MNTSANVTGILIIFQKNLEQGKVKTRLAASVGNDTALSIYKKLIAYTKRAVESTSAQIQVWYSNYIDDQDIWTETDAQKFVQHGKNLGDRMEHAFSNAFDQGGKKVVIIGTDCAELTHHHIEDAFSALNDYDFVIGPANDGGYYLLGMSVNEPAVFSDMEWSTAKVYQQTLNCIQKHNYSVHSLDYLSDVDTIEDWNLISDRFEHYD